MIYWFTGRTQSGKTTLGKKLHSFLQTEKRNWRKDVFHIDDTDVANLINNKNLTISEKDEIASYCRFASEIISHSGCDIVVTSTSPYIDAREEFKEKMSDSMVEIYIRSNSGKLRGYEPPETNFIDVDVSNDSIDTSFSKIINNLNKLNKL